MVVVVQMLGPVLKTYIKAGGWHYLVFVVLFHLLLVAAQVCLSALFKTVCSFLNNSTFVYQYQISALSMR